MIPLVLLHAFPLAPVMFEPLAMRLAMPVHRPALPGFAGRAALTEAPGLIHLANDVLDSIEGDFVIGGCSMGGYIAMEIMRQAPDRIAGVVLMDTKPELDGESAKARREEIAAGISADGMAPWLDVLTEPLLGPTTRQSQPELVATVREIVSGADPAGVVWAQRAMAVRPDSRGTLANWHRPALVIVGAEDALSPVETAREMAALLPDGELVVVEGAGHLSPWEAPDAVAEAIARWWRWN